MKKLYAIIALSLFSVGNAIYLTLAAFDVRAQKDVDLFCDLNETFSCANLFTYDFAWIFGIPFSMIALFVYPIIILIAILAIMNKIKYRFHILLAMAIWWVMFNLYIIYNEFIWGVFCLACAACALSITTIWILSAFWIKDDKKIIKK